MKALVDITKKQLFDIANIATGNYFLSEFASKQKEVETGGRRRKVEWEMDDEKHTFVISSDMLNASWFWYAKNIDKKGRKYSVNCLNPAKIIDYCDKNNLNIRNK
jgi:hypothetical protein